MIQLKASHLLMDQSLVKEVLEDASHAYVTYYPERQTLLVASVAQAWFGKMHKASQHMLKARNAQGDKSLALHEILIDHELDEADRPLPYEVQQQGKMLRITLA